MQIVFYTHGMLSLVYSLRLIFFTQSLVEDIIHRSILLEIAKEQGYSIDGKTYIKIWGGALTCMLWLAVGLFTSQWFYFLLYNLLFLFAERRLIKKYFKDGENDSLQSLTLVVRKFMRFTGVCLSLFIVLMLANHAWLRFDLWRIIINSIK